MNSQITDTVLMIRPVAFQGNKETAISNFYQQTIEELEPLEIQKRALGEFDRFVQEIRSFGINVIVIEEIRESETPDSIFPNNWVSFHSNGSVMLYPMLAEKRRRERRTDIIDQLRKDFTVLSIDDFTSF